MNLNELRTAVAENLHAIAAVSDGTTMVLPRQKRIRKYIEDIPRIAEAFLVTFPESEIDFKYVGIDPAYPIPSCMLIVTADEFSVTGANNKKASVLADVLKSYAGEFTLAPGCHGGVSLLIAFNDLTDVWPGMGMKFGEAEKYEKAQQELIDFFKTFMD